MGRIPRPPSRTLNARRPKWCERWPVLLVSRRQSDLTCARCPENGVPDRRYTANDRKIRILRQLRSGNGRPSPRRSPQKRRGSNRRPASAKPQGGAPPSPTLPFFRWAPNHLTWPNERRAKKVVVITSPNNIPECRKKPQAPGWSPLLPTREVRDTAYHGGPSKLRRSRPRKGWAN